MTTCATCADRTGAGPEVVGVDDFDRLRDTDSLFRKFDQGSTAGSSI